MVKRVRKGGELPYINTLAALGNIASLKNLVPVGGHDVGVCTEPLWLGFADGSETFTPFGTTEVEHPEPGEVVYLCGKTVLCRRWTWRQAEVHQADARHDARGDQRGRLATRHARRRGNDLRGTGNPGAAVLRRAGRVQNAGGRFAGD